jgi:fermentation-respiration switch protein FrsA (DUF1100 family)
MGVPCAVSGIQGRPVSRSLKWGAVGDVSQAGNKLVQVKRVPPAQTTPGCFEQYGRGILDRGIEFIAMKRMFMPDTTIRLVQADLQRALEERNARIDRVEIPTPGGAEMKGWYVKAAPGMPTVLYAHGNTGNMTRDFRQTNMASFVRAGYGFLTFDYRGYGESPGQASEQGLYDDYRSALNYLEKVHHLKSGRDIVAVGESLGGAVVVDAASEIPFRGVLVFSTFTTMEEMMILDSLQSPILRHLVPGIIRPTEKLNRMFRTIDKISNVKSPLMIAHGGVDGYVPLEMAQRLHVAATGALRKADLYVVPGGDHNDLFVLRGPELVAEVGRFLSESEPLLLTPPSGQKIGILNALREMWA